MDHVSNGSAACCHQFESCVAHVGPVAADQHALPRESRHGQPAKVRVTAVVTLYLLEQPGQLNHLDERAGPLPILPFALSPQLRHKLKQADNAFYFSGAASRAVLVAQHCGSSVHSVVFHVGAPVST